MILSHRWRFVFIKGRKVAGTSVEMALSTLCGRRDIVTPITPRDERERLLAGGVCRNFAIDPAEEDAYRRALADDGIDIDALPTIPLRRARFWNHMPLTAVLALHGRPLTNYRIFAIERSPYSKVLSWANMRASYAEYAAGGAMNATPQAIAAAVDAGLADGSITEARNIDLYRDSTGKIAVELLRYNELPKSLHDLLQSLGASPPELPHAKKGLMADSRDPRSLLRAEQIEQINELFDEEFTAFGYPTIESKESLRF